MTTRESKVTAKHLQYSLAMADVCISEEVADLTLRILERLGERGDNFSLKDACEIRAKWEEDYNLKNEKVNTTSLCDCQDFENGFVSMSCPIHNTFPVKD